MEDIRRCTRWKKISITFELDRPFTDQERIDLLDALVGKSREVMGRAGNLIRWTAVTVPDKEDV